MICDYHDNNDDDNDDGGMVMKRIQREEITNKYNKVRLYGIM